MSGNDRYHKSTKISPKALAIKKKNLENDFICFLVFMLDWLNPMELVAKSVPWGFSYIYSLVLFIYFCDSLNRLFLVDKIVTDTKIGEKKMLVDLGSIEGGEW